jgi:hypothetical protein
VSIGDTCRRKIQGASLVHTNYKIRVAPAAWRLGDLTAVFSHPCQLRKTSFTPQVCHGQGNKQGRSMRCHANHSTVAQQKVWTGGPIRHCHIAQSSWSSRGGCGCSRWEGILNDMLVSCNARHAGRFRFSSELSSRCQARLRLRRFKMAKTG